MKLYNNDYLKVLSEITDGSVDFRLPGSNNWYSRYRILLPEGPACI